MVHMMHFFVDDQRSDKQRRETTPQVQIDQFIQELSGERHDAEAPLFSMTSNEDTCSTLMQPDISPTNCNGDFAFPSTTVQEPVANGGDVQTLLFGPPILQRQYSISTVLEMIEDHTISDRTRENQNTPSPAVNIPESQNRYSNFRALPADCKASYAQPSSDRYGNSPARSGVSCSPLPPTPFTNYQDLSDTPNSSQFDLNEAPNAILEVDTTIFETTCTGIQETSHTPPPPFTFNSNKNLQQKQHCDSPVFGSAPLQYVELSRHQEPAQSDNHHRLLTNASSCPNFEPISSPETVFDMDLDSSPGVSRRTVSCSSYSPYSPISLELEEIASIPEEEFNKLDRTDQRRIRNNIACRHSRMRRKQKKIENERKAVGLENENIELRKQIRRLELECSRTKATLLRRMSES